MCMEQPSCEGNPCTPFDYPLPCGSISTACVARELAKKKKTTNHTERGQWLQEKRKHEMSLRKGVENLSYSITVVPIASSFKRLSAMNTPVGYGIHAHTCKFACIRPKLYEYKHRNIYARAHTHCPPLLPFFFFRFSCRPPLKPTNHQREREREKQNTYAN
uniref:Uncharacterized protein TCIL3000_4_1300 n=1 Tax=Trypanosoma congolense (strain IL3000) TaxID=1068625 RepID=G0UKZ0_TRYCI|nr:unnamed protein product [Trypanosoma congolense IL3000]